MEISQQIEPLAQIFLSAGVSIAFHPVTYTKTLIQLGHEPLPPLPKTSIFGRQVLAYPSFFKYLGHIKKTDGFLGMYRGLSARLLGTLVGSTVSSSISEHLKTAYPVAPPLEIDEDEEALELLKRVCKETSHEMVSRCVGVIMSHPCHVIMLRSMAQFIGRETDYDNFFVAVWHIYKEDGILGFFAGLAPRLIGEVVTIWLVNLVVHTCNTYLLPTNQGPKTLKSYTNAICTMMVTQLTYPFSLVSNVMAVNNCGLVAGSPIHMDTFPSWMDCWRSLRSEGQLKRGSSLFWRYYKGPVVLRHDGKPMPASAARFLK